jgi:hypothetical protein
MGPSVPSRLRNALCAERETCKLGWNEPRTLHQVQGAYALAKTMTTTMMMMINLETQQASPYESRSLV